MKMRPLFTPIFIISSIFLFNACTPPVNLNSNIPVEDRGTTSNNANQTATTNTSANDAANDPLNNPKSVLAKRSIYFDYDSFTIKEQFLSTIQAHADYLIKHPSRKILIQGNTDERGGREYNIALGQKRAEAVRKSLALLGVSESQVEAVSLGKEKPKATGEDEAAWSENRRADIIYQ